LKEARNKSKGVDKSEYDELKKFRDDSEKKEKMKKGKYEEIINDLESKISESSKYKDFYDNHLVRQEGVLE
jgi:hypothetical protein